VPCAGGLVSKTTRIAGPPTIPCINGRAIRQPWFASLNPKPCRPAPLRQPALCECLGVSRCFERLTSRLPPLRSSPRHPAAIAGLWWPRKVVRFPPRPC